MKDVIENFIVIPNEIALSLNYTLSEKMVYGFIFSNADVDIFTGTNTYISEHLGISVSTISKSINKLEKENLIEILFKSEKGTIIRDILILTI